MTTRYLRKQHLLERYFWRSKISIDRAVRKGDLPPPDTYMNGAPLWNEQTLDRHDAERLARPKRKRESYNPIPAQRARKRNIARKRKQASGAEA